MLGITAVLGFWVFRPLLQPRPLESLSSQGERGRERVLEQAKADVYEAIKEMEFDYGMGKISEDDYQELKSQYTAKAVEILKEVDSVKEGENDIDVAIEREVQQLREKQGEDDIGLAVEGEVLKARGKKRSIGERKQGEETVWKVNFCPQCGRKVAPKNKFCQGCGVRLIPPGRRT